MKHGLRLLPGLCFVLALLTATPTQAAVDPKEGEQLFKANCTSCHAVKRKVIGPALAGVWDRRDEAWIIKFVKNSQAVIKSGDEYAVNLYKEYNETLMTAWPQLTDDQIRGIIAYVKQETEAVPVAAAGTPTGTTGSGVSPELEKMLTWGLAALVAVLVAVCVVLIVIIAVVAGAIRAKEKSEPFDSGYVWRQTLGLLQNKFVLTVITLVVVGGATNWVWKQSLTVGLHKGYAPIQPVAFSHKLHAGQYGVSCNYCHIGVEKGKSATIPGANICMNCHNYIQEGAKYGAAELSKVRGAYEAGTPIEWVRIHNLPDLVYFNHAQHVKVGGIECNKCHGNIEAGLAEEEKIKVENMEVMYQVQDLSMGWCINCHRQTNVDVTKSEYYTTVHNEWVAKIKNGTEKEIKVSQLGGLECSKCHY